MEGMRLQWGRTLSSAEVQASSATSCRQSRASMGPHSFKCGSDNRNGSPKSKFRRFNGAALFQVRKFVCGDIGCMKIRQLQWGRTLSSAEVCQRKQKRRFQNHCFNGAALFQVRKSSWDELPFSLSNSFNGAALFQVRK